MVTALDHGSADCAGRNASASATRFEALEPIRQGVRASFGVVAKGIATGLKMPRPLCRDIAAPAQTPVVRPDTKGPSVIVDTACNRLNGRSNDAAAKQTLACVRVSLACRGFLISRFKSLIRSFLTRVIPSPLAYWRQT